MINEFISEGEEETTDAPETPAADAPVEGETTNQLEGDNPPAEGGESTETPAEGEGTPEGGESTETPAEGGESTETPAEGGETPEGGSEEKPEETPAV